MKYIIVVDNDSTNCSLLKDLLIEGLKERNLENVRIGAWYHLSDDIDESAERLCLSLKKYVSDTDSESIHLLIDLLLTTDEEEHVNSIAEHLIFDETNHSSPASGIILATKILSQFGKEKINISFMSKWLNLQSDILDNYNGIANNPAWDGIHPKSFLNPINENHYIINRQLSVQRDNAKTVVDVLFNIAFSNCKRSENG